MFFHRAGDSPLLGDFFLLVFISMEKAGKQKFPRKENCKIV